MAVMVGVVGALSAFYHDSLDIENPAHRELSAMRMLAKVPTIAAMAHKYYTASRSCIRRTDSAMRKTSWYMMFATPTEEYKPNPVLVRALDRISSCMSDHEQNGFHSTCAVAGSSRWPIPFACIASGIAALWGPRTAGQTRAALKMLEEVGDISRA